MLFILTQVAIPLISFKTKDEISKPVEASVLGIASGFRAYEFYELDSEVENVASANVPDYYEITIPKLGIKNALVESNPPDLSPDDALGHYVGSSYPGEVGNTFIYGHSVLPAFYNPKNYKTIFSTLGNLSVGDELEIKYNNNSLKYKVEGKKTLKPEDVDPLAEFKPAYLNESTVTLMTCSPPGTKYKRLLVNAVLVD